MSNYISPEKMDNITEGILSKANIGTTWNGIVEKVDIDSLIEFEYGLNFVWENIDNLAEDGVVWAAINPKRKVIYINETHKQLFQNKMGTLNFSKAHELGHWVLHVTDLVDYDQLTFSDTDIYYCRDKSKSNPQETQADMFAGSILMPKDIISNAIHELKNQGKVVFPQLYNLADKFEVSISALVIRIKALNLLYISDDKKIYNSVEEATGQMSFF